MIRRRGSAKDRTAGPLGVVSSAIFAAVVLVVVAAVYALVTGDRFAATDPGLATPVGSLPAGTQPPAAAVRAFEALVRRADRTFHVDTTTEVTVADTIVTVASSLDHAGPAYAGTIDVTSPNKQSHDEIVTIPPTSYVRETGAWRSGDAPKRSLDPFAALTLTTPVADLGIDVVDGQPLHHLRLALLPVDTTFAPEVKQVVYVSTSFDVWVNDAGTPLSADFLLRGRAVMSEKAVELTIHATFTFSRVGVPITITAPTG
ncbi:MAG: hypothetical protein ACRDF7_00745 [Candidatus Limnocylindrales bacterium]